MAVPPSRRHRLLLKSAPQRGHVILPSRGLVWLSVASSSSILSCTSVVSCNLSSPTFSEQGKEANDNHSHHFDFVQTFWVSFILTVVVGPATGVALFGDIVCKFAIYVELRARRLVTGGASCSPSLLRPVINWKRM